jgi:peptide deformylase
LACLSSAPAGGGISGGAIASPPVDRLAPVSYLKRVTKLDIITIPDRKLRLTSEKVERVDDDLRRFMDQMLETMYAADGLGLAAIQVGVPRRVITIDVARREDENAEPKPLFLINPEIVSVSDETAIYGEGCLSIPEYYADVERPADVRVRYVDRDGKTQEVEASGILAVCVQHEIDHLNGKLFIDYLSKLKRDMVIKKFTKQARLGTKPSAL